MPDHFRICFNLAQQGAAPPTQESLTGGGATAPPGTTVAPGSGVPGPPSGASSPFGGTFIWLALGALVVMLLVTTFGQKKQQRKREAMISAIKKHDRVQTIGGVIGSVVEIKPNTVVLKVDESSNTRITFSRAAIQQVLDSGPDSDGAAGEG